MSQNNQKKTMVLYLFLASVFGLGAYMLVTYQHPANVPEESIEVLEVPGNPPHDPEFGMVPEKEIVLADGSCAGTIYSNKLSDGRCFSGKNLPTVQFDDYFDMNRVPLD